MTDADPPMVGDQAQSRRSYPGHSAWEVAVKYLQVLDVQMEVADTTTVDGVRYSIQAMQDATDDLLGAKMDTNLKLHTSNWSPRDTLQPILVLVKGT